MRIQKVSVIFSWVIVGLVFLFTLGVVAAIKKWIDRDWATGISEVSVLLTFLLVAALFVCFFLDRAKQKKPEKTSDALEEEFAGLELEDDQSSGIGFDNEDPFEELEPLNMDAAPIESQSSISAENLESLEDEDPDMKKLEI
ncbi:MAG: hypothetical protein OSA43_00955 [Pirellulales bacterium]|jgi:hypothetical protein|nr:hypothetical protein [Pirellulales bacterium]